MTAAEFFCVTACITVLLLIIMNKRSETKKAMRTALFQGVIKKCGFAKCRSADCFLCSQIAVLEGGLL